MEGAELIKECEMKIKELQRYQLLSYSKKREEQIKHYVGWLREYEYIIQNN